MPHLILNVSPELAAADWTTFFAEAHELLSPYADINSCKSGINQKTGIYIGNNLTQEKLVFLEVLLRPRPEDILKIIGDQLFECLKNHTQILFNKYEYTIKPTLEVRIMPHYWQ